MWNNNNKFIWNALGSSSKSFVLICSKWTFVVERLRVYSRKCKLFVILNLNGFLWLQCTYICLKYLSCACILHVVKTLVAIDERICYLYVVGGGGGEDEDGDVV